MANQPTDPQNNSPWEKNDIDQRDPKLEADFRCTAFSLASDPPPRGVRVSTTLSTTLLSTLATVVPHLLTPITSCTGGGYLLPNPANKMLSSSKAYTLQKIMCDDSTALLQTEEAGAVGQFHCVVPAARPSI